LRHLGRAQQQELPPLPAVLKPPVSAEELKGQQEEKLQATPIQISVNSNAVKITFACIMQLSHLPSATLHPELAGYNYRQLGSAGGQWLPGGRSAITSG